MGVPPAGSGLGPRGDEGGRACERAQGGGDASSHAGSCSQGQTKGTMGSAAGLLGPLLVAGCRGCGVGRGGGSWRAGREWLGLPLLSHRL